MSRRTETELWEIATRELTPRQLQIFRYWTDHHSTRQIARALNISESTVRAHLERCFQKLKPFIRKDAA